MDSKPKKETKCGLCGSSGTVKLVQSKQILKLNDRTYNGKWWRYECSKCGKNYTTTESDTISYNEFKAQVKLKQLAQEEQ